MRRVSQTRRLVTNKRSSQKCLFGDCRRAIPTLLGNLTLQWDEVKRCDLGVYIMDVAARATKGLVGRTKRSWSGWRGKFSISSISLTSRPFHHGPDELEV